VTASASSWPHHRPALQNHCTNNTKSKSICTNIRKLLQNQRDGLSILLASPPASITISLHKQYKIKVIAQTLENQ
jgi:hypothetical protein